MFAMPVTADYAPSRTNDRLRFAAMSGDLGRLPVPVSAAVPGAGPAAVAGELLGRVRAELPVVGALGEREQVLVAAWLTGLRSARTRRAYAGDVAACLAWLAGRDAGVLAAGRVHVDLWAAAQLDAGAAAASVRRTKVFPTTWREAVAVLDEIFGNPTDLPLGEHTDTAGHTLATFAIFNLAGLQFSPLADVCDQARTSPPSSL